MSLIQDSCQVGAISNFRFHTGHFIKCFSLPAVVVLMAVMSLYSDKIVQWCICQQCQGNRNDLKIISFNLCSEGAELLCKHTWISNNYNISENHHFILQKVSAASCRCHLMPLHPFQLVWCCLFLPFPCQLCFHMLDIIVQADGSRKAHIRKTWTKLLPEITYWCECGECSAWKCLGFKWVIMDKFSSLFNSPLKTL